MDFTKDLRAIAEVLLDYYGLSHTAKEDATAVVRRWVNIQLKLIRPIPREVFLSPKIQPTTYDAPIQQVLQVIEKKFLDGVDVNSHLSKRIFKEDYTDYLLSDWEIYHLHLSLNKDTRDPYFAKRSDKLLFVMLNDSNVYFIDVRDHDEDYVFAQKELLQAVHDNWPEILAPYRLKGIFVEQDITDPEEIHKLRKVGVTIIHKVCDALYAPAGGGITTASTAIRATTESDKLFRMARSAEEWARTNGKTILKEIQAVYPKQDKLELHLDLNDKGFFVVDTISKVGWEIKP